MKTFYKVGNHLFMLDLSGSIPPNYAPFCCEACDESELLFRLSVGNFTLPTMLEQIGDFNDEVAHIRVANTDSGYLFCIAPPNVETMAMMLCNSSFTEAQVRLSGHQQIRSFELNNCLMMLYAFASAPHNTLLLHASVVMHKGKGYLFQGKSGTGKSTHSRLWIENIVGTELLNDDNPVIRIDNQGEIRVYGSPWSGKTPCYINRCVPLGAIVRLRQAPHNVIRRNATVQAFAALKPTCSTMLWDERIHAATCDTITKVVENRPSYTLECLPDNEAALMCHKTLTDATD